MTYRELLERDLSKGLIGGNKGLPHGFSRLTEYIPGIQQGTYYLVAAESSVGKSAFVNNSFVFNPIDWYLANKNNTNIKLKIHYYSFEISTQMMLHKAVCRKIYLEYGILLDVNYILSRGKYKVAQEHYDLIMQNLNYFDEMQDILYILDVPDNPTGIFKREIKYASLNGKGVEDEYFKKEYVPNNPNLYTLIIIDHVSLTRKERGFNTKEVIDKLSEHLVLFRNKANFTPIVIQQLNRASNDVARIKMDKIEPMLSDFKDSGSTVQDCNIALALFSPSRYEISSHRGYLIDKEKGGLNNRYRNLSILKNRDGESDKNLGLQFIGEIGHFQELKKSIEMQREDYTQINNIKRNF